MEAIKIIEGVTSNSTCVNVPRLGKEINAVDDILNILSRQTGRSISSLTGDIRNELRNLETELYRKAFGFLVFSLRGHALLTFDCSYTRKVVARLCS